MAGFVVMDITQEDYDREIRNKDIDEFAEKLRNKALKNKTLSCSHYGCVSCGEIEIITEQLKKGGGTDA